MDNLKKRLNERKGFTLVELLVVIAIIAILSVTAYVALGGQTGKARDSRRQSDLSAIQSALEIHALNHTNKYPETLEDIDGNIMAEIPLDPWDTNGTLKYDYKRDSNKRGYQLVSILEGDSGDFEAYIVGNGSDNLTDMGFKKSTCEEGPLIACDLTEEAKDTCIPYCQP